MSDDWFEERGREIGSRIDSWIHRVRWFPARVRDWYFTTRYGPILGPQPTAEFMYVQIAREYNRLFVDAIKIHGWTPHHSGLIINAQEEDREEGHDHPARQQERP